MLILGIAAASSALTAGAIAVPAWADEEEPDRQGLIGPGRERIEEFEACMREQGFELGPESTVRVTPDGVTVNGEPVDPEDFREARRACGPLFPKLGPGSVPRDLPDDLQARLRSCLEEDDI